ncbi:MAG: helix-turn-helix transcriptional regulator [Oscillospiraceae bacterium]|nr:helix-turn-helix transcriptional regulator [Oscillospiraceae bacterium]
MDQGKIGRFISTIRKQQGMTQEELGERLGVTNKTISRWETGKYMPDIDKLQELSAILSISINELLAGERIEDAANFVKKADENLVAVLSNDSTFGLQDRIAYFKRKWLMEHKLLILSGVILWCILFAVGIYMKQPIILCLLPITGLIIYGYIRNQMMIYVEDRAFVK